MDINTSIQSILNPIISTTESLTGLLKILFGGLFGLYLITVIMRFYEIRSLKKLMNDMRNEIKNLNETVKRLDKEILINRK